MRRSASNVGGGLGTSSFGVSQVESVDAQEAICFDVSADRVLLALVLALMHSISRSALDEMRQHSREEYPNECCGVVVRDADGVARVHRVRNIQDEMHAKDPVGYPRTARIAYAGHPQDLRVALEAADAPGCALVAFYHSHPDHDSYFSAEDTAQATPFGEPSYPDALQIVVSVYDGTVRAIKAFAWSPSDEAFVETPFEEGGA